MKSEIFDLEQLCKRQGLRLTGARRIISEIILRATDHPDVSELFLRAREIDRRISLATVYRTVNLLREHGIIEKHHFADGPARLETMHQKHHDHLIDIDSGKVIEFRSDEIERLQQAIAMKHGFDIVSHRLEIYVRRSKQAGRTSGRFRTRKRNTKTEGEI